MDGLYAGLWGDPCWSGNISASSTTIRTSRGRTIPQDGPPLVYAGASHLQVARPPVQIQMDVLDLSKFGKLVVDVLLCGLFMDSGDEQDPTLDR